MNEDLNANADFRAMLDILETELNTTLGYSDERRLFLQAMYLVLLNKDAATDRGYFERMLQNMSGDFLDDFGQSLGVERSEAKAAQTILRFWLQETQSAAVIIKAGTRATDQTASVTFTTDITASIPPGSLYVDVAATSLVTGEMFNGIELGQISVIVDPTPFVSQVENITVTSGGSDIESDDSYRERIRLERSKTSTAGARETYQYWALSANPKIKDVQPTSPSAGEVLLTVLMEDGQLPDQVVMDEVYAAVNADEIRPLTDHVTVQAPGPVLYGIDLDYYVKGDQQETMREAVEGEGGVIQQYTAWQMEALGRDINPDYLRKLLFEAGVLRATVRQPVYTEIEETQVAHVDSAEATLRIMEAMA